jgi:hypothetical protein
MGRMTPDDEAFLQRFLAWRTRPKTSQGPEDDGPTPQDQYAALMKSVFAPALREAGLKGSNGRFELPSTEYWAQLGFQKSTYSDRQEVRFTVNLSVIERERWEQEVAARTHLGRRPTPSLTYGSFQAAARLGQLVTGGEDLWWHLVRGEDSSEVARSVRDALVNLAVPWLRNRTSISPD